MSDAATSQGTTLATRLADLEARIVRACQRAGRRRDEITLVAVSKTQPAELIRQAHALGLRHFGENYVQELAAKAAELSDLTPLHWHFIGHLQRNKAQQVVGRCELIHSIDTVPLLQRIDRLAQSVGTVQSVLLQLKLAADPAKSGASEAALADLLAQATDLAHVRCLGLMTMPPLFDDPRTATSVFAHLRQLRDDHQRRRPGSSLQLLSMGMSGDFESAIAQGATHIRVGSVLFGERS